MANASHYDDSIPEFNRPNDGWRSIGELSRAAVEDAQWVRIPKDTLDHPLFARQPMCVGGAFMWLASKGRIVRAHFNDLHREWCVAERKVAAIIRKLEKAGFISVHGSGAVRTIFIKSDMVQTCGYYATGNAEYNRGTGGGKWRGPALAPRVVKAVYARDGHVCAYCGSLAGPFHIDHVKPVALGGGDAMSNLKVACQACNLSKGGKALHQWRRKP